MAWMRSGDNLADHPIVLAVLEHPNADDRHLNEVFGFVMRCALHSASHYTDYVISYGTAVQMAGSKARADELLELALFAGYLTSAETDDSRLAFKLFEDPEFIHIRSREEIEFERQRDRDRKDQSLTVPVWLRDGDACRYCRRVVSWRDRKGGKGATFDHTVPGAPATFETYVVCCTRCNETLGDMPAEQRLEYLLPPPPEPHFTRPGVKYWGDTKWVTENSVVLPEPSTASKLRPGDFMPGETKISALLESVQKQAVHQQDGSQPETGAANSSGPKGRQQPAPAPAEHHATRGPKGRQQPAPAPARDEDGDGPKGRRPIRVRPAPASPDSSGPKGPLSSHGGVDPAEHQPIKGPSPAQTQTRLVPGRYQPGLPGRGVEISGYPGRDGSGRVGSERGGSERSGRPARSAPLPSSVSNSTRSPTRSPGRKKRR